jgi:predicted RNA binding protein YcfA (HicA-like mRNA interferase family)
MTDSELVHLLRNTPVLKLIKALEKDGFVLKRATRSGGHIYYHSGKTLKSVLEATQWTQEDLKRLGL